MLVYRGFSQSAPSPTVLAIGNFDGVHLGHRALLAQVASIAKGHGWLPAALSFEPHPREFFTPASAPARLSTLREKLELIAVEGIGLVCVGHFNRRFAAIPAAEFITSVLVDRLQLKHLVVGDDFRFGAGRRGDFAMLGEAGKRFGFTVEAMPGVLLDGQRVSSSAVRAALAAGEIERAARLLGRPYSIDGRVVHGDQLGRRLGFATANIRIKHDKPPLTGVFAVEVRGLGAPHAGVANLGLRPSANQLARPLLEVHLFDFAADIYGAHLNVRFLRKLRSERRFPDVEALREQIARDVESAKRCFTS